MKFAVLDFETTGNQPHDTIIQVGLVIVEHSEMIDRYTTLVNPGVRIPSYIEGLTGLTNEMVQNAPSLEEVLPQLVPRLENTVLVAHQAGFDLGFLQRALDRHGYLPFDGRVLDTMDLLRIVYPGMSSLQLSMVSSSLGIEHERPHQADSDAEATARIWLHCLERLDRLPLLSVQRISQLFDPMASDLGWFLQQIRIKREVYSPVDPDGHRYYRQLALHVEDWGDEPEIRSPEDAEKLARQTFPEFYRELKGILKNKFQHYEERAAQEQMLEEVESSFEDGRHLLVEAGTGTGKSLGYLIPSLYYGIREAKKVVISTHTINLQEQLRQRDLPLLNEIFPVPFRASVIKGRNHYLCLRKFENKLNLRDFAYPEEDSFTAAQLTVWLSETLRGDEEELHLGPRGSEFWRTVASDSDSCLNRACPWFKKCFYHRARHEATLADIVITNHSMLFTDIKAEHRVLPSYEHLVVDEAHHFEEVASKHLGMDLHYSAFVGTLLWLYKDNNSGLLPLLRQKLARSNDDPFREEWEETLGRLIPRIVEIKTSWDEMCELMFSLFPAKPERSGDGNSLVHRIKKGSLPAIWDKLLLMEENIHLHLGDLIRPLEKLLAELKDKQEEYDLQSLATDLGGVVKDLIRSRDTLRFFFRLEDDHYVYWLEANGYYKSKSIQLVCVPEDVSPILRQYFFDNKDSVIMTSATLSVDKSFRYTCEQLGLDPAAPENELKTVQLPSPFNYREQALVCIPRDFPSLKGNSGEDQFTARLIDSLRDVAIETKGRMLVLFTSYRMLKQTYPGLKANLEGSGIQVFGQGFDSTNRSKLTRLFQEQKAGVLLGTSSFWEGVDIPGDALSCLAIVRLPFQPPTHPLVEARCEAIQRNKQNPFLKYSVPQAVIRFKQGFGRLVRTGKDRGVVIIYDTRVIDTSYGKHFLYSLPGPKIEHMTTEQLVPRVQEWMRREEDE
jgi:ATP-dependent DNA helicase DinG